MGFAPTTVMGFAPTTNGAYDLAIYHFSIKIGKRSEGKSAIASAAYRSGTRIVDRTSGEVADYLPRRGVVGSVILAPSDAPEWVRDRGELWNRVEEAERRKDAQLYRELEISLPHELSDEQRRNLVVEYVTGNFVNRGMVADISWHRPHSDRGDKRNEHVHVMLTLRELDGDGFSEKKQRDWNAKPLTQQWRKSWEDASNRQLERAGSDKRISCSSNEVQGISRIPEPKLGVIAAALERKGIQSRAGDSLRAVRKINSNMAIAEREIADAEQDQIYYALERFRLERELQTIVTEIENPPQAETVVRDVPEVVTSGIESDAGKSEDASVEPRDFLTISELGARVRRVAEDREAEPNARIEALRFGRVFQQLTTEQQKLEFPRETWVVWTDYLMDEAGLKRFTAAMRERIETQTQEEARSKFAADVSDLPLIVPEPQSRVLWIDSPRSDEFLRNLGSGEVRGRLEDGRIALQVGENLGSIDSLAFGDVAPKVGQKIESFARDDQGVRAILTREKDQSLGIGD